MKVVVADTSPINYLILTDSVDLLRQLYERVVIPAEVFHELTAAGSPPVVAAWARGRPDWLEIGRSMESSERALEDLDQGERAAILLALRETDVLLLIDESAGRSVASKLGIPHTGTLGVLKAAARENLIDLREALERLRKTNFRASAALFDALLSDI